MPLALAARREPHVPDGRPVGQGLIDHDRAQLPGHHHPVRAPRISFWRLPLLVWANFATSTLVWLRRLSSPARSSSSSSIASCTRTSSCRTEGGDVVSYQHIFWFYSHPAVYIMMLPGFGIASEVISVFARSRSSATG